MNAEKNYYDILGVNKNASDDEIKKAYRNLARKYHPDINKEKDAEAKFKEISQAYEILGDSQKKSNYDQYGSEDGKPFGSSSGSGGFGGFGGSEDIFGDIFSEFFGGGASSKNQKKSYAEKGADLRYKTELSLEEMFNGTEIQISYNTKVKCEACSGEGGENGSKPINCKTCHGSGRIRQQKGPFIMEQTCGACSGTGLTFEKICKKCSGSGAVNKTKRLEVKVPSGIDSGEKIRISGEGEAGLRGGETGDLYVEVYQKQHKFFKRKKSDLYCDATVSFVTAALGGSISIPSIDGEDLKLNIIAGTQNGSEIKIKAKGMKSLRSSIRGDLFVNIQIEVPINLNQKQKELLNAFEKEMDEASLPKSNGFFKKVKDFWKELNKDSK